MFLKPCQQANLQFYCFMSVTPVLVSQPEGLLMLQCMCKLLTTHCMAAFFTAGVAAGGVAYVNVFGTSNNAFYSPAFIFPVVRPCIMLARCQHGPAVSCLQTHAGYHIVLAA
jgi:hypothetical protein